MGTGGGGMGMGVGELTAAKDKRQQHEIIFIISMRRCQR